MIPGEITKYVAGYEGIYCVSTTGKVYKMYTGYGWKESHQCIKPELYLRVEMWKNGKRKQKYVHRLVAEAFIGPCPPGYSVDHIDNNPTNNCVSNLRYLPIPLNCVNRTQRPRVKV